MTQNMSGCQLWNECSYPSKIHTLKPSAPNIDDIQKQKKKERKKETEPLGGDQVYMRS